jgi:hypothetical protein
MPVMRPPICEDAFGAAALSNMASSASLAASRTRRKGSSPRSGSGGPLNWRHSLTLSFPFCSARRKSMRPALATCFMTTSVFHLTLGSFFLSRSKSQSAIFSQDITSACVNLANST